MGFEHNFNLSDHATLIVLDLRFSLVENENWIPKKTLDLAYINRNSKGLEVYLTCYVVITRTPCRSWLLKA